MVVPFFVRYEDRLFPRSKKSRSRLYAKRPGYGSSSVPGRVPWVENIKYRLTVSLFYVNNKRSVTIYLFEYISICYMKQLKCAAGVEVCDLTIRYVWEGKGG